jgi:hypothetical protein
LLLGVAAFAVGAMSFVVPGEPHRLGVLLGLAREEPLQTAPPPVLVNEVQQFADTPNNLWNIATCALSGSVNCPNSHNH